MAKTLEGIYPSIEDSLLFGPFRLVPSRRLLLHKDDPVRVGSRALPILIHLVERAGDVVSKKDLITRAWPKIFVGEANLRVHIAALRKALGDSRPGKRYIITVPGRGYSFVASVSRSGAALAQNEDPVVKPQMKHNLPAQLTRIVGRKAAIAKLAERLLEQRFMTIAGPGGIGKTTAALAIGHQMLGGFRDGVWFVDLAQFRSQQFVPGALASALGLAVHSERALRLAIEHLRTRRALLIFDNCEHVLDAAASLIEELLKNAPDICVLATSREPLRAESEYVERLEPLAVPRAHDAMTTKEALAFAAVQLFVERAAASIGNFRLTDADISIVANICRRLDGIALAIELAAGLVGAFGVRGVAALLNDRFHVLTTGRRTALWRHQTLAATLDWSHALLSPSEQILFRRLAIFPRIFTFESVNFLTSYLGAEFSETAEDLAALVAKSLLCVDINDDTALYRLLDTTRNYALEKLLASGEFEAVARRHADFAQKAIEYTDKEDSVHGPSRWPEFEDYKIGGVSAAFE